MKSRLALFVVFVLFASALAIAPAALNPSPASAAADDPVPDCSFVVGDQKTMIEYALVEGVDHRVIQRSVDDGPWTWVASKGNPAVTSHVDDLPATGTATGYRMFTKTNGVNSPTTDCTVGDRDDLIPQCSYVTDPNNVTIGWAQPVNAGDHRVIQRSVDDGPWTWVASKGNPTVVSHVDPVPATGTITGYRMFTNTNGVANLATLCDDIDMPVPELYATSDGSTVEIGWQRLAEFGVVAVEVFRDGESLGTTSDGALTVALAGVGVSDASFTARSIGVSGTRSTTSQGLNFVDQHAGLCVAVALNDGTTAVTWADAPDGDVTLLDFVDGRYQPLEWLPRTDSGIAYYVDSHTSQAGQPNPDYRATLVHPDGTVSSQSCDGREFSTNEFSRLAAIEFPVTSDGFIGGSSSSAAPVRITLAGPPADAPAPAQVAQDALPACSAGGLFVDMIESDVDDEQYVSLYVPAGMTVTADAFTKKLQNPNGGNNGEWTIYLEAFHQNTDGTLGGSIGNSINFGAPYYWYDPVFPHSFEEQRTNFDDQAVFTATQDGNYLLRTRVSYERNVDHNDLEAASWIQDIKFTNSSGDVIAEPCALSDLFHCQVSGGNYYNSSGQDIVAPNGQVLKSGGCYHHESCATTPFNAVKDYVAKWACRNDAFLDAAQDVAVTVAVVAGMIYIAPVAAGVVLTGAGIGLVLSAWTCDQSDNGWYVPATSFDHVTSTCVTTETQLGAIFSPLGGAIGGPLGRRLAVGCAYGAVEGGSTAATHMVLVEEGGQFDAAEALVGSGLGCVTAGTIGGAVGPRPRGIRPTALPPRSQALVEIDNLYPTRAQRTQFLEATGNSVRKSNFGEMWTDQAMLDLNLRGFRVVHTNPVSSIDDQIIQGIDHVFAYIDKGGLERFVIVETKWSPDGLTQTTSSVPTADGRQMSDGWLLGSDRLLDAVSPPDALAIQDAIVNGSPVDRLLAHVDIGGNVGFRELDANGEALATWWTPDL